MEWQMDRYPTAFIKKDLQKVIREFLSNNRTSLITEVSDETLDLQQKFFNDMLVNKSGIVKRYGKDAEKVMKGKAMNLAKKETEKMNKQKLKELVRKSLMQEESYKPSEEEIQDYITTFIDLKTTPLEKAREEAIDALIQSYEDYKKSEMDEGKKPFPDLTGDGKVTKADILKGRGVKLKEDEKPAPTADEYAELAKKVFASMKAATTPKSLKKEDIDLGHEDNEPHMIKGELYRIGKYAMELYGMLEEFEEMGGEFDFPAWWQSKITTAMNNMVSAKHYLDFEIKEPAIDAAVDAATGEEPHMGEPMMEDKGDKHVVMKGNKFYTGTEFVSDIKDAMRYNIDSATMVAKREKGMVYTPKKMNENSAEETLAGKIAKALKNIANKDASDQSNLKQARTALNKGNIDAAKKIAKPYLSEKIIKKLKSK
jgi:hypothetical protein